jgi:hypothetical protein
MVNRTSRHHERQQNKTGAETSTNKTFASRRTVLTLSRETNLALPYLWQHDHNPHQTVRATDMRKQPPNTTNDNKGQNQMTFDEWLQYGYKNNFCSPPVCEIHDGLPTTATEDEQFSEGEDPCIYILRLYDDNATSKGVEANHSASTWRATNLGWVK